MASKRYRLEDYIVGPSLKNTWDVWYNVSRKLVGPFYSKSQAINFCNSVNGTKFK